MRILQIAIKPPLPSNDGGAIAIRSLAEGLIAEGIEVNTLTLETEKHPCLIEEDEREFAESIQLETHKASTYPSAWRTVISSLTNPSYITSRFDLPDFHKRVKEKIQSFQPDVLLIESIFAMPYARHAEGDMKVWYRAHNLEYKLWEDRLRNTSAARRMVLSPLVKHLRQFEIEHLKNADIILPVSDDLGHDIKSIRPDIRLVTLPISVSAPKLEWQPDKNHFRLRYIGALDWQPNIDGLKWFCKKILPIVTAQYPHIVFEIAGRNPYPEVMELNSRQVKVIGEVKNAKEYISKASLLVMPLLTGSGVRVKIIEALSVGVPFVATRVATSGIDLKNERHGFISDHPGRITSAILSCIEETISLKEMSTAQQAYYQSNYSPAAVIRKPLKEILG